MRFVLYHQPFKYIIFVFYSLIKAGYLFIYYEMRYIKKRLTEWGILSSYELENEIEN